METCWPFVGERLPAAVRLSEGGQWYEGTWPDEARCGLVLTLSVQAATEVPVSVHIQIAPEEGVEFAWAKERATARPMP